jgi:hypothetical protein
MGSCCPDKDSSRHPPLTPSPMSAIRIRSLLILMVCSIGSVWAQNAPTLDPNSDAWHARNPEQGICPAHPNPPAVDVGVDSCVDGSVKAAVEEPPGVRLNPDALPADDPELFGYPVMKQRAVRSRPPTATSWTGPSTKSPLESLSREPEPAALEQVTSPAIPRPADAAGADSTESSNLGSASALHLKLSRTQIQRRQVVARRRSAALQANRQQQCRELSLSEPECRLRLHEQKVFGVSHSASQPAASNAHQQPIP